MFLVGVYRRFRLNIPKEAWETVIQSSSQGPKPLIFSAPKRCAGPIPASAVPQVPSMTNFGCEVLLLLKRCAKQLTLGTLRSQGPWMLGMSFVEVR